jgi:two-component system CheB/CheR fusion protein
MSASGQPRPAPAAAQPDFDVVAVATSAGGLRALGAVLGALPARFPAAVIVLREVAFESDPLAQVVVDARGNLALLNDQARRLFGLSMRDVGRPLQDLEVSYRPVELRSYIEQVHKQRQPAALREVEWPDAAGALRYFNVQVLPLVDFDDGMLGVKVLFQDVTRTHGLEDQVHQARQELETAREELQTTNEELQSTNEELETMNEELQSTNEELRTMNDEMQRRGDELNDVNAFLESILTSLRAAVVVLDRDLQMQVWNGHAQDMWGLRPDEVVGKHFLNLDIGVDVNRLRQPIRDCLAGQDSTHEATLPATNRRGKPIDCKVMCTPLLGTEKETRGVILLMEEKNSVK